MVDDRSRVDEFTEYWVGLWSDSALGCTWVVWGVLGGRFGGADGVGALGIAMDLDRVFRQ